MVVWGGVGESGAVWCIMVQGGSEMDSKRTLDKRRHVLSRVDMSVMHATRNAPITGDSEADSTTQRLRR